METRGFRSYIKHVLPHSPCVKSRVTITESWLRVTYPNEERTRGITIVRMSTGPIEWKISVTALLWLTRCLVIISITQKKGFQESVSTVSVLIELSFSRMMSSLRSTRSHWKCWTVSRLFVFRVNPNTVMWRISEIRNQTFDFPMNRFERFLLHECCSLPKSSPKLSLGWPESVWIYNWEENLSFVHS